MTFLIIVSAETDETDEGKAQELSLDIERYVGEFADITYTSSEIQEIKSKQRLALEEQLDKLRELIDMVGRESPAIRIEYRGGQIIEQIKSLTEGKL